MTDHSPEPWFSRAQSDPMALNADDYERAAACVNACAGIPTEDLGDVKALLNAARVAGHWLATEFETDLEDDNFYAEDVLRPLRAALRTFGKD